MQKRSVIATGIILLVQAFAFSQGDKKFLRQYKFHYEEKILSDYSNILQKTDTPDFQKTENVWNGEFSVHPENDISFLVSAAGKSSANGETHTGSPVRTHLFIDKRAPGNPIQRICYSSYPGREEDVLIRNILASVQYFQLGQYFFPGKIVEEYYTDGRFQVSYRLLPERKTHWFILDKKKITTSHPGAALNKIIIDSFYCHIFYNRKDSFLHSLELTEFKHQKVGNKTLAYIKTNISIEEDTATRDRDDQVMKNPAGGNICAEIYRTLTREERKKEISRSALRNTTIDQLVNRIKKDSLFISDDQRELVSELRAALYLFPEFFKSIKGLLDPTDNDHKRYQVLMSAIVGSESLPAQEYLGSLLEENSDNYSFLRAILPSMGIMTYPVDSSLLKTLSLLLFSRDENISSLAGLTLSNMSNQLKYTDTLQYRKINNVLFQHYSSSGKNKNETLEYLKELGNSGDETGVDILTPLLYSEDPETRSAAIYALRFILTPGTDSVLAKLLRQYPDDSLVTGEICQVIKLRFPSEVIRHSIYYLLQKKKTHDWPVYKELIDHLKFYADELPALDEELKNIFVSDQELNDELRSLGTGKKWYEKTEWLNEPG